jgi:hypothetical protein
MDPRFASLAHLEQLEQLQLQKMQQLLLLQPTQQKLESQWQELQQQIFEQNFQDSPQSSSWSEPTSSSPTPSDLIIPLNKGSDHTNPLIDLKEIDIDSNWEDKTHTCSKKVIEEVVNDSFTSPTGESALTLTNARLEFSWLVLMGDSCLSSKQSTKSTSKLQCPRRKKYRPMYCAYCADFNPSTAWARVKPRKLERASLWEHSQSAHHARAIFFKNKKNQQSVHLKNVLVHEESPIHQPVLPMMPSDFQTERTFSTIPLGINHSSNFSIQNLSSVENDGTFPSLIVCRDDGCLRRRGIPPPNWLIAEGTMRYSDLQLQSGKDLSKIKKKYKMLKCSLCVEFMSTSPWAVARPRKCELCVFEEHERSTHHRRAVEKYIGQQLNISDCGIMG